MKNIGNLPIQLLQHQVIPAFCQKIRFWYLSGLRRSEHSFESLSRRRSVKTAVSCIGVDLFGSENATVEAAVGVLLWINNSRFAGL
jgi:hypothetical protein